MKEQICGFIGCGWIGSNYADNFEERGYKVVRYDIDKYKKNKDKIKDCDIVFIAVPTPSITNNNGEIEVKNDAIISAIECTKKGQIIVIKSTIMPGTTEKMQKMFPDRYILHSPELLTEATAKYDVANPQMNIIGTTKKSKSVAGRVMRILPCSPFEEICDSKESEMVKYMINCWFYMKVLTMNTFYDVAKANGIDYDKLIYMMGADKRVGRTHLVAEHQGGRGAGGHCFIKDFAGYRSLYKKSITNKKNVKDYIDIGYYGNEMLKSAEEYNKKLLIKSGKSKDLLDGVYKIK
jgi:UDPglucose 6-dehydrogenase